MSEHLLLQFGVRSPSAAGAWWTKTIFSLRFGSLRQINFFSLVLQCSLEIFVVLYPRWQKHPSCEQTLALICAGYTPLVLKLLALGFLYGNSICIPWILLEPYVFLNIMWGNPAGCNVAAGIPCCMRNFWIPFGIHSSILFTWRLQMSVVVELSMVMPLLPPQKRAHRFRVASHLFANVVCFLACVV